MKGQRLAAVAVGWDQLLRRHRLKLCEEGGIIKVRWLDPLRVEGPPVVWKVTGGVRHSVL